MMTSWVHDAAIVAIAISAKSLDRTTRPPSVTFYYEERLAPKAAWKLSTLGNDPGEEERASVRIQDELRFALHSARNEDDRAVAVAIERREIPEQSELRR